MKVLEVEDYVAELLKHHNVRELVFDRYQFLEAAERLEARYDVPAIVFEQNDSRMADASTTLFNLIREGRVVHDGDPELRAHVLAARGVETPSGFRIQKRKLGPKPVDAAVSLAMATQRAMVSSPPEPFVFTIVPE